MKTYLFVANRQTWIKGSPVGSNKLSPEQKELVDSGYELSATLVEKEGNHYKVKVKGNSKYIFSSHWQFENDHPVSEQKGLKNAYVPKDAGKKTGNKMRLPNNKVVYANEYVVPGVPLTWGEVTKNCSRVPETSQVVENLKHVATVFGEIRSEFGNPIRITSGYRPAKVNAAIGGARRSQHIQGLALDLVPVSGSIQNLYNICKANPKVKGLGNAINRAGFIHIDCRNSGRVYFSY